MDIKDLPAIQISNLLATLLCLIGCYALLTVLYTNYIAPYLLLKNMGLTCPMPIPVFGNILDSKANEQHLAQIKRRETYGKVHGTLFFKTPAIWIGDPELLKEILIKNFSSFPDRFSFADLGEPFRDSLIRLRGGNWKRVRNVMVPAFSVLKLKSIMHYINEASKTLIDSLLQASKEGKTINMWEIYGNYTMNIIFASAFGIECTSKEQEKKLLKAAGTISTEAGRVVRFLFFLPLSLYTLLENVLGGNFMSSTKYITQTIGNVIKERRRNLKQGLPCPKDFLQQMIEAADKDKIDDNEIISQAFVFFVAGYETTASTLTFLSHLLAVNPSIQEKLINEIDLNCPDKSSINYETVQGLKYLDMVISETLRMYPAGFFVNRTVKEGITVKGLHIPKGCMIALPIYGIHHDPDFWPNPEEFIPERFTAEEKAKRHPCSYIPFGSGPRNCIGMRFALLEAKIAIVKTLQNVKLITTKETQIPLKARSGGTLRAANGVHLGVEKRQ